MDKKNRDIYEYELRFGSRVVYSSFFFRFIAWIHARASRFQIDGRLDDESGEPNIRHRCAPHVTHEMVPGQCYQSYRSPVDEPLYTPIIIDTTTGGITGDV